MATIYHFKERTDGVRERGDKKHKLHSIYVPEGSVLLPDGFVFSVGGAGYFKTHYEVHFSTDADKIRKFQELLKSPDSRLCGEHSLSKGEIEKLAFRGKAQGFNQNPSRCSDNPNFEYLVNLFLNPYETSKYEPIVGMYQSRLSKRKNNKFFVNLEKTIRKSYPGKLIRHTEPYLIDSKWSILPWKNKNNRITVFRLYDDHSIHAAIAYSESENIGQDISMVIDVSSECEAEVYSELSRVVGEFDNNPAIMSQVREIWDSEKPKKRTKGKSERVNKVISKPLGEK